MAGEDPEYLAWLRQQPCAFVECQCPAELGPTQAHHHTRGGGFNKRGKGQKAHDHEAFPLCLKCHRRFHDAAGPFRDWNKATRNEWQDRQVAHYRAVFTDGEVF